tara:strand:- start:2499 stop:2717 length:219 start_codon:yes stop_codon:yes gene_type:complete
LYFLGFGKAPSTPCLMLCLYFFYIEIKDVIKMIDENIQPNDVTHKTIEHLFQQQMMMLSKKTCFNVNSFLNA